MTGQSFLNFLCGTTGQLGILDKNVNDSAFRAFMLQCLNLVLKDIQNEQTNWHWRFLEKTATAPTVADQMDYTLPTDIDTNKIFAVFDRTNDRTYRYIPYERFVKLVADPSNNTGDPTFWTLWANVLKLYPVPSSVITFFMNYIQLITPLTDANTSCEIPAKYDVVVIHGALKWAYQFDPKLGSYADMAALYEKGLDNMKTENATIISEYSVSESHREKYNQNNDVDGKKSLLFPLAT